MQMFAQFFGGNDPFSAFFGGGSASAGGPQIFFSTGGDDMHFGIAVFSILGSEASY